MTSEKLVELHFFSTLFYLLCAEDARFDNDNSGGIEGCCCCSKQHKAAATKGLVNTVQSWEQLYCCNKDITDRVLEIFFLCLFVFWKAPDSLDFKVFLEIWLVQTEQHQNPCQTRGLWQFISLCILMLKKNKLWALWRGSTRGKKNAQQVILTHYICRYTFFLSSNSALLPPSSAASCIPSRQRRARRLRI